MSASDVRRLLRGIHLAAGVAIVMFFYGPAGDNGAMEAAIRVVLLPAVLVSGMWMWQAPRLRRLRRALVTRRSA